MGMKSPAAGVKDLLVAANVGTFAATSGWSISVGKSSTAPDTSITCVDTGGISPFPHLALNFPSVQVIVRGAPGDYIGAHDKGRAVIDALLGKGVTSVNGDSWEGITQIGDLASIGYDENNRPLFSANFSIHVEPASTGLRQAIV